MAAMFVRPIECQRLRHYAFILPLAAACAWLITILGLLLTWVSDGQPHLGTMPVGTTLAWVSDISAGRLKPFFVFGCTLAAVLYVTSIAFERYLRHFGRVTCITTTRHKIYSAGAVVCVTIANVALVLISAFDLQRSRNTHYNCLYTLFAATLLFALLVTLEFSAMPTPFRRNRSLRAVFYFRSGLAVALLITCAICIAGSVKGGDRFLGAAVEWTMAFLIVFYAGSFTIDLLPSSIDVPTCSEVDDIEVVNILVSPSEKSKSFDC